MIATVLATLAACALLAVLAPVHAGQPSKAVLLSVNVGALMAGNEICHNIPKAEMVAFETAAVRLIKAWAVSPADLADARQGLAEGIAAIFKPGARPIDLTADPETCALVLKTFRQVQQIVAASRPKRPGRAVR